MILERFSPEAVQMLPLGAKVAVSIEKMPPIPQKILAMDDANMRQHAKDAWTTELYAQNLTNVNASTFTSTNQFVPAESILRPRVLGFRVGYKF